MATGSAQRNGVNKAPLRVSSSFKSKLPPSNARRSTASLGGANSVDSGRVRVAVRLRPRNTEEMAADADFADCVELQPELKRLKLRKNNWDSDTYEFDEIFTEYASQKRVYEVVAKPVVENVLDGYNGTVMAYGQTGTGKTYTLGHLGGEDTSTRGIMVRSMEEILTTISPGIDSISVSYLQLYMETVQDLLNPANDNIPIVEDQKTGDVSLPGATILEIRDQQGFVELLRLGETNRISANTKMNTESSRSHAILMVYVKRTTLGLEDSFSLESQDSPNLVYNLRPPLVRKSKLLVVDLAGSERIQKSGSEGGHMLEEAKSINLSLSALGKCINALAENSSHVPVRDSKITRLLKDSFGGTSRTSLVVTIGPSPRHRAETASTILFGQRAMKVENMLKIKEEFDYKSLSKKLEMEIDKLIAENERMKKVYENEIERIRLEAEKSIADAERNYVEVLEEEKMKCQMNYMESIKKLEENFAGNQQKQGINGEVHNTGNQEVVELKALLQNEICLRKEAEKEIQTLKNELLKFSNVELSGGYVNGFNLQEVLEKEIWQKKKLEEEVRVLQSQLTQLSVEADQTRSYPGRGNSGNPLPGLDYSTPLDHLRSTDGNNAERSISNLHEQVGMHKILSLLESEDASVRVHAVKVVANLAAEEANQKKIVEAGGLTSLLMLLRRYGDETIRRIAAGAIANLAMNETNQELIMSQGGISLLAMAGTDAEDPQTLRMVAGALANLCGNDKLQSRLRSEGGIKALLAMVRCRHPDVLLQVARGIANFAKCESKAYTQGTRRGRSLLIEDGALPWIVQNANNEASLIRRHVELALCHMAQHEVNAKDMINGGALWELVRISRDCSREDIRGLARRILSSSSTFQAETRRLRIEV